MKVSVISCLILIMICSMLSFRVHAIDSEKTTQDMSKFDPNDIVILSEDTDGSFADDLGNPTARTFGEWTFSRSGTYIFQHDIVQALISYGDFEKGVCYLLYIGEIGTGSDNSGSMKSWLSKGYDTTKMKRIGTYKTIEFQEASTGFHLFGSGMKRSIINTFDTWNSNTVVDLSSCVKSEKGNSVNLQGQSITMHTDGSYTYKNIVSGWVRGRFVGLRFSLDLQNFGSTAEDRQKAYETGQVNNVDYAKLKYETQRSNFMKTTNNDEPNTFVMKGKELKSGDATGFKCSGSDPSILIYGFDVFNPLILLAIMLLIGVALFARWVGVL